MTSGQTKVSGEWFYRHAPAVRVCHWINVAAFALLLVSGMHILLDFPALYWGRVGFIGYPAWIESEDLGIAREWAWEIGDRQWGRNWHFTAAWIFVINGAFYLALVVFRRAFAARMLPRRAELTARHLRHEIVQHARLHRPAGDEAKRYNTLQKLSYLLVLFVLIPLMILTGLAQMPAFQAIAPWLGEMWGGRQSARTLHVLGTAALIVFVAVHVFELFVVGVWNEIRAMITGYQFIPQPRHTERNP